MSLAAANLNAALASLGDRPPTTVADHGESCCVAARAWLRALDRSWGPPTSIAWPAWIRKHFWWGPSPRPLHWCQLVARTTLDSGALASMARQVLWTRGIPALAVQMLRAASLDEIHHWTSVWKRAGLRTGWIFEGLTYQEAVAVSDGGRLVVFDLVQAKELLPDPVWAPGSMAAIRVSGLPEGGPPEGEILSWGPQAVRPGAWHVLQGEIRLEDDRRRREDGRAERAKGDADE